MTPARSAASLACAFFILLAAPSHAAMADDPPPPPSPSAAPDVRGEAPRLTPRQEAERDYGAAYREVARAKEDIARGKLKPAQNRFRKALDRATRAVETDTTYFEAWNLVGYAARGIGDYPRSLAAYARCLAINPDYAPAREYLGEAYVELGRAADARTQLAWLEKFGSREAIAAMRDRIMALEASSGAGAPGNTAAPAARPDSASSSGSGH